MPFPEFQRAVLVLTGELQLSSWWLFSVRNRNTVSKQGAPAGRDPGDKDVITAQADQTLLLSAMVVCVFQFLDKLSRNQSPLKQGYLTWREVWIHLSL